MKNDVMIRLFDYLASVRIRDTDLAEMLNITRSNPGLWKKGKSFPSMENFLQILDMFPEIDVEWLIRGKQKDSVASTIQTATGTKNSNIHVGGSMGNADVEIKYLKTIIKEKDEQINLLKTVLQHKK